MKKILSIMLLLSLLLALAPFVTSKENFKALTVANINTNNCAKFDNYITIKNTGTQESTYTFESSLKNSKFKPNKIKLKPKESEKILNQIIIPCSSNPGKYKIKTKIKTNTGKTKKLNQALTIKRYNNIKFTTNKINQSSCPCKKLNFEYTIKNTGKITETYSFSLSKLNEYANFSSKKIILKPNKKEKITLALELPCDIYGQYNISILAKTKQSDLTAKIPIKLDIKECYDYDLSSENYLEFCENTNNNIDIIIKNLAETKNSYIITLENPEWLTQTKNTSELEKDQEQTITFEINPPENSVGEFNTKLVTVTNIASFPKSKDITLKIVKCHDLKLNFDKKEDKICINNLKRYGFTVDNFGAKTQFFNLSLDAPEWADLDWKKTFGIETNKQFATDMKVKPNKVGKYELSVTATGDNTISRDVFYLTVLPSEKCPKIIFDIPKIKNYYETQTVNLQLTSKTNQEIEYLTALRSDDFISIKEKNISLKPEETKILSLVVNPSLSTQSKNYPVKLILKSGNLTITEDFDVIITSKQKELMKYFYYVITTIIILLALILFFIQKNKKSKTNKKTKKLRKHKRKKNTKKSIREKNK